MTVGPENKGVIVVTRCVERIWLQSPAYGSIREARDVHRNPRQIWPFLCVFLHLLKNPTHPLAAEETSHLEMVDLIDLERRHCQRWDLLCSFVQDSVKHSNDAQVASNGKVIW